MMRYFLAMLPILLVLGLMLRLHWGAHQAGPAAWGAALPVSAAWFGLTPHILWISQAKGLLLSLFVLAVMWPALFLYHWTDQNGGISAVARLLERAMPDRAMCLLLLAWALSGMLEGIAGFGLPIAVVAPMLVALGVSPLKAVGAVAVGHSWAVTFGDMGVILQTLGAVSGLEVTSLVPWAALLLGFACLLCGLGAALILRSLVKWQQILALSLVMALVQYGLAVSGLVPLSAFGSGLAGLLAYLVCAKSRTKGAKASQPASSETLSVTHSSRRPSPVVLALTTYGALALLMAAVTMLPSLRGWVQSVSFKPHFPEATASTGFVTPAGQGQVLRPLAHPGSLILLVSVLSIVVFAGAGKRVSAGRRALAATCRSAATASLGVISMVGLSTLMDHCGMSYLLAEGLKNAFGTVYPVISPCVGILGAFATGSNNNSNVLFGSLQKNVALLLQVSPALLTAAQTAGGSLGSMLAPAKIVVGCSTVGQVGREGVVLRQTVPIGLVLGFVLGLLTLILSRL